MDKGGQKFIKRTKILQEYPAKAGLILANVAVIVYNK